MSQDAQEFQFLFSASSSKKEQEDQEGAGGAGGDSSDDALSFYFEEPSFGPLLELAKEFGSFEIFKENADSFLIRVGQYQLRVTTHFHQSMITLLNISTLTPGAGELFAKVADLIFYNRRRDFMLRAGNNLQNETLIWEACRTLGIKLVPLHSQQAQRFQLLETEQRIKENRLLAPHQGSQFLFNHQSPDEAPPPTSSSPRE